MKNIMKGKDTGYKRLLFMPLCANPVSHGDFYEEENVEHFVVSVHDVLGDSRCGIRRRR